MKSIYEFKKGDNIVRITPAKPCGGGMFTPEGVRDRSYIGERMIFAGIANGCVYLRRTNKFERKMFGDKLVDLPLDIWDDGWDYYIDPSNLLESILPEEALEDRLKRALVQEDYELAEKLKKLIEDKK
jgi:hypothetical protein